MQAIKLTKDIPGDGLAKGDIVEVDAFSAAALIKRGDAEEYDPAKAAADTRAEGGEELSGLTIDDIVDPQVARNRRTMTATIVGGPGTGPSPAVDVETEAPAAPRPTGKPTRPEMAPPGANPAGGATGGGQ